MTEAKVEEEPVKQDEPDVSPEQPEPEEEKPRTEDGAPAAESDWDGAKEFRELRKAFYVQNNFHGGVHAEHGTFGMAFGQPMSATATGPLDPGRVAEALRCFVRAAKHSAALTLLRRHGFVAIGGPDGIGKRALGLDLLRTVCGPDAPLVAVSPARGLGQLAADEPVAGTGYLVVDHLASGEDAAVRSYEAERIATNCAAVGAYLVLTTTSKKMGERYLSPYAITVGPPDPVATLHSHLGGVTIEPDILAMAEQHVRTNNQPRVIASLAKRILNDPAGAVDIMQDVPKEEVAAWFDRSVSMRDLLSITALAVGGSQPEPIHDLLLDLLRAHTVQTQENREAAPHISWEDEKPRQRDRDHPLVTTAAADDLDDESWLSGRRVRFRHEDYRAYVLRELYDRYDHQLWRPVRAWLHELCRNDPRIEIRGELAQSLALLAKENFMEVRDAYLTEWASGLASERRTAAMVLWFMSFDDRLAPVALTTALDWGQNNGLNRAVTSALALGGPLGIRFPDEAMQRLCFLALRAKRIGDVARIAIGGLFAVAAADGSAATGRVLATVSAELTRAVDPRSARTDDGATELTGTEDADDPDQEQYEQGWTGRVAKAARSMVLALLEAEQVDGNTLVATLVLREQQEHVELLGEMWAEVLCSAPHRPAAIDKLVEMLRSLKGEQDVTNAVARLGAAIYAAMPAAHRPLRAADLVRAMKAGNAAERPPRVLVSTLLAALTNSPTRS